MVPIHLEIVGIFSVGASNCYFNIILTAILPISKIFDVSLY